MFGVPLDGDNVTGTVRCHEANREKRVEANVPIAVAFTRVVSDKKPERGPAAGGRAAKWQSKGGEKFSNAAPAHRGRTRRIATTTLGPCALGIPQRDT